MRTEKLISFLKKENVEEFNKHVYSQYVDRMSIKNVELLYKNLQSVNLRYCIISNSTFIGCDLSDATLSNSVFINVDFHSVNLSRATLYNSIFERCQFNDSILTDTELPFYNNCPQEGSFIGYKKLIRRTSYDNFYYICKLEIPSSVRRTGVLGSSKCRASEAKILEIRNIWNNRKVKTAYSIHSSNYYPSRKNSVKYTVGETVYADSFDDDIRAECTNGIHFFINRDEALHY